MKISIFTILAYFLLQVTAFCQTISLPYSRTSAAPFIWGISGHPLVQQAYNDTSKYQAQLNSIKDLNMSYYRVDVNQDTTGAVSNPGSLTTLLSKAASSGVKILPVIGFAYDTSKTNAQLYSIGQAQGYAFASAYGSYFDYIELGNELDIPTMHCPTPSSCPDGSLVSFYDTLKINRAASYLKGLASGVNSLSLGIKTIINSAGYLHYGFFKCLQNKGVPYDILGFHFYSEMDHSATTYIIDTLATFGKDIWFTEFNAQPFLDSSVVNVTRSDSAQVDWLPHFMKRLYSDERVKAAFVYELYNQPAASGSQKAFGLISCDDPNCNSRTNRPAFDVVKYKIEELTYGYEDFMLALYVDLICARPDPVSLAYWTNRLKVLQDRVALTSECMYEGYYGNRIDQIYNEVLGHAPDPDGKAYWLGQARGGMSWEDIIIQACWSGEFWSASGSTNSGFVEHLYEKLLKRSSTSADTALKNSLISGLNSTSNRTPAIDSILFSTEYLSNYIDAQYLLLLNRGRGSEDTYWLGRMKDGLSQKDFMLNSISSDEYWIKAYQQGYQLRRNPSWNVGSCGVASLNSSARLSAIPEGLPLKEHFMVYPNPSDGEFIMDYTTNQTSNWVTVYNSLGRIITRQLIYPGKNTLTIQGEKAGIYIMKIQGSVETKRLIIK